jgi:hypothetical protein
MSKNSKLTQEQKFLIFLYSQKGFKESTLKVRIYDIKKNAITIENLSQLEKQFYDIFTIKDTGKRFVKCQEAYDLLEKELNKI